MCSIFMRERRCVVHNNSYIGILIRVLGAEPLWYVKAMTYIMHTYNIMHQFLAAI